MVLGYIANSVRRFHVFVANSVQEIQDKTSIKQWKYVDTKTNLADEASRGLRARELTQSKWIQGPDFLWKPETEWNVTLKQPVGDAELLNDDPEVKKIVSLATAVTPSWSTMVSIKDDEDDENLPRHLWQLARVIEAYQSADGHVRTVKLAFADRTLDKRGRRVKPCKFLERPVQKLVLLQEASET